MQIRHTPLSGGYCGEVPPLPIPNREVKLTCADGTAMLCGRVGSRLLSISEASITKVVGAFQFSYRFAFLSQLYPTDRWAQLLLPFYPFTFLPLYFSVNDYGESSLVMFMYKMLMNCGFAFIKSANLRTKMFQNAKKSKKIPPPFIFFYYLCPQKIRTIM